MKAKLAYFAVPILTIALFLVALEVAVRIVLADGMNFDVEMWKYAQRLKTVANNPEIAHEHVRNSSAHLMGVHVKINANKLRDREIAYVKPADTVRILMLGDSLTFGWGVAMEHTTPKLLEESLNTRNDGRHYEVINAGVGNYNTSMEVAYFVEEGHRYNPDIVVLNYFINDAEPTPRRKAGFLANNSEAYVFLAGRFDILMRQFAQRDSWKDYYRSLYEQGSSGWTRATEAIRELGMAAEAQGFKLLIANYPELHELGDYPFTEVTRAVEGASRTAGARFVDLLAAVRDEAPEKLWVSRDDAHPNALANKRFAATLEKAIADMLAVPGVRRSDRQ